MPAATATLEPEVESTSAESSERKSDNLSISDAVNAVRSAREAAQAEAEPKAEETQPQDNAGEANEPAPAAETTPEPTADQPEKAKQPKLDPKKVPMLGKGAAPKDAETAGDADDAAGDDAEDLTSDPKIPEATQQRFQKRIGKLTQQRREAEERAQAAEAEVARLRSAETDGRNAKPAPMAQTARHPELLEIDNQISNLNELLGWLDENPDGGPMPGVQGEVTEETAREWRRRANASIAELSGRRGSVAAQIEAREELQRAAAHEQAVSLYPQMFRDGTEEFAFANRVLEALPGLQEFPDFELGIGDMIRGRMARLAEERSGGNGKIVENPFEDNGTNGDGRLKPKDAPGTPAPVATSPVSPNSMEDAEGAKLEKNLREAERSGDMQRITKATIAIKRHRAAMAQAA